MRTGIELIAQERKEQIEKHNWSLVHDYRFNNDGELIKAALAILDHDHNDWPKKWEVPVFIHINDKPWSDRLVIAAALIAAEIDRLQNQ